MIFRGVFVKLAPIMTEPHTTSRTGSQPERRSRFTWPAWRATLSTYQEPRIGSSLWQLVNTLVPYGVLWVLMIGSIRRGYPYGLTFALAVVAAAFLVRIFILFHDCVHGSLFQRLGLNTFFGHALGLLVFTPFDDWRFSHLRHHASYANLDARGFGDIWTLTRREYEDASWRKRLGYRLFRNPLIMFGLGAFFTFVLRFRLPARKTRRKERASVLFTNVLIIGVVLLAARTLGLRTYLKIQLPVLWMAGAAGIWLFYVQHQFEDVYWMHRDDWNPLRAAMEGSSYYDLPAVPRWFSGNIGYHHVHHLVPRIPNYRLKQAYEAVPAVQVKPPLTIRKSLSNTRLKLWDEDRKRLVGFH